jgi:hypothetical protein
MISDNEVLKKIVFTISNISAIVYMDVHRSSSIFCYRTFLSLQRSFLRVTTITWEVPERSRSTATVHSHLLCGFYLFISAINCSL